MSTPRNQSVMKAFCLLRSFRQADEWLTSTELSRRAGMPEASGYRLVQTLEEIGAVIRDGRGRYRRGMLLLELSNNINPQVLWRTSARRVIERWSKQLGMLVQVGIYEEGMVTYVARAGELGGGQMPQQGMQFEAYCTALGKMLLSELPEADLRAYLREGELVAFTPQTIVEEARLREELQAVRRRGTALDDRETSENLRCIAAPIRNPAGTIVAAVSFCDHADRLDEPRRGALRGSLFQAADELAAEAFPWSQPDEDVRMAANG